MNKSKAWVEIKEIYIWASIAITTDLNHNHVTQINKGEEAAGKPHTKRLTSDKTKS